VVVVCGSVVGGGTVVCGVTVVLVGGLVVSGGVVVSVVLLVAGDGAAVMTTGARVAGVVTAAVFPPVVAGSVAGVVVATSTLVEEVVESPDRVAAGMVTRSEVVVGLMVVVGDWVATCCLGELSLPVVTSNSRATRAIEARA
jgi:hypothetical protein